MIFPGVRLQMKLLATLLQTQASKNAFSLKMVLGRNYSGPEALPKRHSKIIIKNKSSQIATKMITTYLLKITWLQVLQNWKISVVGLSNAGWNTDLFYCLSMMTVIAQDGQDVNRFCYLQKHVLAVQLNHSPPGHSYIHSLFSQIVILVYSKSYMTITFKTSLMIQSTK